MGTKNPARNFYAVQKFNDGNIGNAFQNRNDFKSVSKSQRRTPCLQNLKSKISKLHAGVNGSLTPCAFEKGVRWKHKKIPRAKLVNKFGIRFADWFFLFVGWNLWKSLESDLFIGSFCLWVWTRHKECMWLWNVCGLNWPGAFMISPFWLIDFEVADYYTSKCHPLYKFKFQRWIKTPDA